MSLKAENSFINSIHRLLPHAVYHWKIADRYHNGVPDCYYEGSRGVLFIEYKHIDIFPSSLDLTRRDMLSPLQMDWLERAGKNGVPCAVILGSEAHGLILYGREAWGTPVGREKWLAERLAKREIADWLTRKVSMCAITSVRLKS